MIRPFYSALCATFVSIVILAPATLAIGQQRTTPAGRTDRSDRNDRAGQALITSPSPEALQQIEERLAQRRGLEEQVKSLEKQVAALKGESSAADSQVKNVARVFRVSRARAEDVTGILLKVLGNKVHQVAADQLSNSVIVSAREENFEEIAQLIQTLDEIGSRSANDRSAATLQIRMLWLVDGVEVQDNLMDARLLTNAPIRQAIESLGLANPRVICHHVTSVAKKSSEAASFEFNAPAIIGPNHLYFQGKGTLTQNTPDQFQIALATVATVKFRNEGQSEWRINGSVAMPSKHYVIMGSTNLVLENVDGNRISYPAAFVIYLDRANIVSDPPPRQEGGDQPRLRGRRESLNAGDNPFGMPAGQEGREGTPRREAADENPFGK
jgi:hypothetical protein